MTVFIGWSGGDKKIAEETQQFLLNVFDNKITITISTADIALNTAVKGLLDQADYAIFCISPSSHIPWICSEAGYLKKADTPFAVLLFDMNSEMLKQNFPPLASCRQIACSFFSPDSGKPDQTQLKDLLLAINERTCEKHKDRNDLYFDNGDLIKRIDAHYKGYERNIQKLLPPSCRPSFAEFIAEINHWQGGMSHYTDKTKSSDTETPVGKYSNTRYSGIDSSNKLLAAYLKWLDDPDSLLTKTKETAENIIKLLEEWIGYLDAVINDAHTSEEDQQTLKELQKGLENGEDVYKNILSKLKATK